MGHAGFPFDPNRETLLEIIDECHGHTGLIIERMDIHASTWYRYLRNNPDISEIIEGYRAQYVTAMVEMAETKLWKIIEGSVKVKNPAAVIRACMYVLSTHAKKLGYTNSPVDGNDPGLGAYERVKEVVIKANEARAVREAGGCSTTIECEVQLLDRGGTLG